MELVFLLLLDQMGYAQYVGHLTRLVKVSAEVDDYAMQVIEAPGIALMDYIYTQSARFIAQPGGHLCYTAAVENFDSNGFGKRSGW